LTKRLPDVATSAALFTVLGVPAGVVPVTRVRPGEESDRPDRRDAALRAARAVEQGSAGLPVGVQLVARYWREDLVLAAMQAIETEVSSRPDHPTFPPR
jgi:fatty acid amide hydrolase